jgi:hypothetical protein
MPGKEASEGRTPKTGATVAKLMDEYAAREPAVDLALRGPRRPW